MEKLKLNKLNVEVASVSKEGLSMGEFLFTLSYMLGFDQEALQEEMLSKHYAKWEFNKVVPSLLAIDKVRRIIGPRHDVVLNEEQLLELAKTMKQLFPKGFMVDGIPWTEGPKLIVQRLEGFFVRFDNYTAEDIEDATRRYVVAKAGSPFMKSLKNFIYKEVTNADGTVDLQSDLYNFLENPDDISSPMADWTSELRE